MYEICERLRSTPRADIREVMREAADEIARLRLTDAEREAVEWAAKAVADPTPVAWYAPQIAATLRGLMERLK